ncbi:MAG: hypothetical protein U0103_23965 [Candidatus Obscuribacterales bacterium]
MLKLEEIGVRILNQAKVKSTARALLQAKQSIGLDADYDLNRGLNETIDWYKAFRRLLSLKDAFEQTCAG